MGLPGSMVPLENGGAIKGKVSIPCVQSRPRKKIRKYRGMHIHF